MAKEKFRIVIIATYRDDDSPDPSSLLDTFQDEAKELLEHYGEDCLDYTVSVEVM